MNQTAYIYLHGFASSPQSNKACYLRDRFAELNLDLKVLDLNRGDFSHLTLTRQLEQTAAVFPPINTSVTLIGSSFGGLTAVWLAEKYPQVQRLVLLAPAFNFLAHWLPRLGKTQLNLWQKTGYLSVYHYGEDKLLPLHYGFVSDAESYDETQLARSLPTLILHGTDDEVIPIAASRNYASQHSDASQHSEVKLIELDSDHSLADMKQEIWQAIEVFCSL
ncbi:YqiA/YcfP family alpha/beta fold hydrolase [Myxosarcina sp. GI1]|uniref:YqiA/YcfP family alpha/beta fold hydrolase n=1 Tax=Myxosarcina sp. GI1 TaxID=1541065 RepID=UPI0005689206|nr:YqiA/YcfP family alpha/beta fold hydrolase [Myxosarcina sp. GI1]